MELVLRANVGSHADHKDVAEACSCRDDPDEDTQHNVGQKVLERRDAISIGLAAADVRRIATILKLFKVAEKKKDRKKEAQMTNTIRSSFWSCHDMAKDTNIDLFMLKYFKNI